MGEKVCCITFYNRGEGIFTAFKRLGTLLYALSTEPNSIAFMLNKQKKKLHPHDMESISGGECSFYRILLSKSSLFCYLR